MLKTHVFCKIRKLRVQFLQPIVLLEESSKPKRRLNIKVTNRQKLAQLQIRYSKLNGKSLSTPESIAYRCIMPIVGIIIAVLDIPNKQDEIAMDFGVA